MGRLFGPDAGRLKVQSMVAGRLDWLVGGTPSQVPDRYAWLSPVHHVHPGCPPTLLVHGRHDEMAPVAAMRQLHERLERAGVPVTGVYLPHTDHAFDLLASAWSPQARTAIHVLERFLAVLAATGGHEPRPETTRKPDQPSARPRRWRPWRSFSGWRGVTTIIAAVLATRSRRWRYIGRAAVGALFVLGGALVNASYLASGADYAGFADTAHFAWVTDAWRAVVAPNVVPWISLLVVFEATVGALILSGGRRTQLGYVGVIGFYLALWLFGVPAGVGGDHAPADAAAAALSRAARYDRSAPAGHVEEQPLTGVGS